MITLPSEIRKMQLGLTSFSKPHKQFTLRPVYSLIWVRFLMTTFSCLWLLAANSWCLHGMTQLMKLFQKKITEKQQLQKKILLNKYFQIGVVFLLKIVNKVLKKNCPNHKCPASWIATKQTQCRLQQYKHAQNLLTSLPFPTTLTGNHYLDF